MPLYASNINALLRITAATLLTVVAAYFYVRKRKVQTPTVWKPIGKVTKLFVYPLKSGRRIEVQSAECTGLGMQLADDNVLQLRDRSFVIYGEQNGEIKTARVYPKFVLIESAVHDKNCVKFDAPDQRTLYVKLPEAKSAKPVELTLHNTEKINSWDCGNEAAFWFSKYFLDKESGLRLGYHDGSFKRNMAYYGKKIQPYPNINNKTPGMYSDLTSYHLINQASMDDLNSKSEEPISVNNFRPNILVEGDEIKPFQEEEWEWIKIGDVVLRNVKPCTRCILTTVHPEAGVRSNKREPLKTLEKHNILKDPAHVAADGKAPVMGIHLGLNQSGKINVNDVVYLGR